MRYYRHVVDSETLQADECLVLSDSRCEVTSLCCVEASAVYGSEVSIGLWPRVHFWCLGAQADRNWGVSDTHDLSTGDMQVESLRAPEWWCFTCVCNNSHGIEFDIPG